MAEKKTSRRKMLAAGGAAAAVAAVPAEGQTASQHKVHWSGDKKPENQPRVVDAIAAQVAGGDRRITGVMVESFLEAGRQDPVPGAPLVYGRSITDGCIDWQTSMAVLDRLSEAVDARRG